MSTEQNYWNQMYANACDQSILIHKPSTIYKPKLYIDGDKWCALYGDNVQDGVAGFGSSAEKAMADFDFQFKKDIKK